MSRRTAPLQRFRNRIFAVTVASAHDGRQPGNLLDSENAARSAGADTACRSVTNLSLLALRGLAPQAPYLSAGGDSVLM